MVEFQQGLLITAIGMGLVFAVIIVLWGLMAVMMRVTSRELQIEENTGEEPLTEVPLVPEMEMVEGQRRAAAAAAAVQITIASRQFKKETTNIPAQQVGISPWQAAHRLRQLEKRKRRG